MKIKFEDERKGSTNYVTNGILDCVKFWNREGQIIYDRNISGELGDESTNEMAKSMDSDDFILELLLIDCKAYTRSEFASNSGIKFECGRTRSHIWVHEDDDRKLMIYAEK